MKFLSRSPDLWILGTWQVNSRELLEFLEASDDDDKDRRKRRRRKPRMWRSARERASWLADLGQAFTLARVAYCTMTLVLSASEMLDAIDARKVHPPDCRAFLPSCCVCHFCVEMCCS